MYKIQDTKTKQFITLDAGWIYMSEEYGTFFNNEEADNFIDNPKKWGYLDGNKLIKVKVEYDINE